MSTGTDTQSTGGVATGIVVDNDDPEGLGRVRVDIPEREGTTDWIRVATPMAGRGYGTYFLPEVEDEVLVAFDRDTGEPYVLGSLWGGGREPPVRDVGENDVKAIETRSGHRVRFEDAADGGVTIETADGHRVLLEDGEESPGITIEDDSGANSVEIDPTEGEVCIEAQERICLEAPEVDVDAAQQVDVTSKGSVAVEGKAQTSVGSKGQLNLSSDGLMAIDASGPMSLRGALININ